MQAITSRFANVAVILAVIFAVVEVFYYFKFKRANVSDTDKSLWHLRLSTAFIAALICVAMLYLPLTGFYSNIDLAPAARETAFQNLVSNQQRLGSELDQLREVLFSVFMMLMAYLFGVGAFIGRLWRQREKLALANEPEVRKPLGLKTD